MSVLTKSAAVTPNQIDDAIKRGQTYADYAATIPANREALDANYAAVAFTPDEITSLEAIDRPLKIFAIVEEWCPDVIANLPIVAQAAVVNPGIELCVLYRPDHRAFADAYPGATSRRSHIPTYVVFDGEDRELGVLIERPAEITEIVKPFGDALHADMAKLFPGVDRAELPADWINERAAQALQMRVDCRDAERKGIVDWLVKTAHQQ